MRKLIQIGDRVVGPTSPPFVVAEMSGNHNQSLERAIQIVDAAARAGVDAIKLQTYTAQTMTLDLVGGDFSIADPDSLWSGTSLFKLYDQAHTPWEWHEPIFERAKALGLLVFSTPFDHSSLEFLERLSVPCYKIASFEITDLPLIRSVAQTGKPIIMSTGMASLEEIGEAVEVVKAEGNCDLILLKCTSTYPADPSDSHIRTMSDLSGRFDCLVGLSDHTAGIGAAVASVALGATVLEKHFTLRRADGGVDSAFSMEPEEMGALVSEARRAWQSLGGICYGGTKAEESSKRFRRSIYISEDLPAGAILNESNLRCIRPAGGLAPKFYDQLLGRRLVRAVSKGTPASWDLVGGA